MSPAPFSRRPDVRLQPRFMPVRPIDAPQAVGYGATHRATGPARIATVPAGYADGYLRSLFSHGHAWVAGHRVPVVGRVSMDFLALPVNAIAHDAARPGYWTARSSPNHDADAVAREAGNIDNEIRTSYRR